MKQDGRQRVVVERVFPEIDEGRFAVKRVVGDTVDVQAHLFCDGHDKMRAEVLYRGEGAADWTLCEMTPLGNDEWEAAFAVDHIGTVSYTVRAWIDTFRTWQGDLRKKVAAGQAVQVELMMGAELLRGAAQRADGEDARQLEEWAALLQAGTEPATELALDSTLTTVAERYPDRQWASTYPRTLQVQVNRPKARFSTWYELFPRSCGDGRQHGTFADCERMLPELARLGFDVLYLPPIHPIGQTKRKGKNNSTTCTAEDPGSPWAIGAAEGGHDAILPALGSEDDFRHLMAAAAEWEIDIAMDLAFQCSPDHPYVKAHPEWFRWRPDGTVQFAENPPKRYEDILPIYFETEQWQELWDELRRVVFHWLDVGVRVFRVDNPHTKPFAFWEWLIAEVRAVHPDVIFLSEAFTRPKVMGRLAKVGFDQSYTYFTWRNTAPELTEYLQLLSDTELAEYLRPNFWPNTPDILPEFLQYGGRPAFVIRLILAATLSSSYGMYGPAFELCAADAIEGREEYLDSEKFEIKDWNREQPGNLRPVIERINRIRRENAALQRTANITFCETDNDQLLAYIKTTPSLDNIIVTVVNLDPHNRHTGWMRLPLHELDIEPDETYMAHDLLSDDRYMWHGEWNYVSVDPHTMPAHVLCLRRRVRKETDFDYFM